MNEPRKSGWNWWALLFGPLWYLYKGMIFKALILLLITIITAGFGSIIIAIYAAIKGNEDYYIHWRRRQIALGNIKTDN